MTHIVHAEPRHIRRHVLPVAALLLGMALPLGAAQADWMLDGNKSALHFVSVKKGTVGEVHHFGKLAGTLAANGQAKVEIDLTSVNTRVPIRDERMRKLLFQTEQFPTATITATVDTAPLQDMKPGERRALPLNFKLSLHGASRDYTVPVSVVKLADGGLAVSSRRPVVVNASDFGLSDGVEALRKVVNLPSIAKAVPVTFDLVFTPKK